VATTLAVRENSCAEEVWTLKNPCFFHDSV